MKQELTSHLQHPLRRDQRAVPARGTRLDVSGGDRATRVCVVSHKECWQDEDGNWISSGGFPLQMAAIRSLFDEMTLLIVRGQPREGGVPLPPDAEVAALRSPTGENLRRKLSVLMNLPYYAVSIATQIRRAEVVHVTPPGDMPFLGMLFAIAFRKHLIVRYCGSWRATKSTTLMNRVTRTCMRLFAGGRNVMLATGEEATPPAAGVDWVFATALSTAELDQIRPSLERGLADPPRLVYAGRLSPEKGVKYLIEAVHALQESGFRPLPLVTILGDGPERTALEHHARTLGCEPCFEFVGQVDRTELSTQLSRSDVCVQPSLSEGFSKAWLDAMAHGLPVVASEVGAARGVIGDAGQRGWLVPPGDVPALAEVLKQLITAPIDWPSLRQRCRDYVEQRTLEAWADRIGTLSAQRWDLSLRAGKFSPRVSMAATNAPPTPHSTSG